MFGKHAELVDSLRQRLDSIRHLIQLWRTFNRLKHAVSSSIASLDRSLTINGKSFEEYCKFKEQIPQLKTAFEHHHNTSLLMRQLCQELLSNCDDKSRSSLLSSVHGAHGQWQSVLSKLMSLSEESAASIAGFKLFHRSLNGISKSLNPLRESLETSMPTHHDMLQELQSHCDIFTWRLDKMNSKCTILKFDLTSMECQPTETKNLERLFEIGQGVLVDTRLRVCNLKLELNDRLSVWSDYISRVNETLQELQRLERLYMNCRHLTVEDLLDEMVNQYDADLRTAIEKVSYDAEHLPSSSSFQDLNCHSFFPHVMTVAFGPSRLPRW